MNKKQYTTLLDYQKTFESEHGKKVLWDLMKAHHILSPTFAGGTDVHSVFLREGERNVVLRILTKLKKDPRDFLDFIEGRIEEDEY